MVRRTLRSSLHWWVFLPIAPVLLLVLLDCFYEALSYFRFYGAASVIDAISIFVTAVPLAPYWAVSMLMFGVHTTTPYAVQLVAITSVALVFSIGLFILSVLHTIAFQKRRTI
jgi:hypothetical protein